MPERNQSLNESATSVGFRSSTDGESVAVAVGTKERGIGDDGDEEKEEEGIGEARDEKEEEQRDLRSLWEGFRRRSMILELRTGAF